MRRIMLGIAALALPVTAATAGAVVGAGPAGASAPVSCTKVTGNISGSVTLKGCGGGLGKGTAPAVSLASGGTVTWKGKNKGTTTIGSVVITTPTQSACNTGSTEEDFTGMVSANTSKANILGTTVTGRACVSASGSISLVKHTTLAL